MDLIIVSLFHGQINQNQLWQQLRRIRMKRTRRTRRMMRARKVRRALGGTPRPTKTGKLNILRKTVIPMIRLMSYEGKWGVISKFCPRALYSTPLPLRSIGVGKHLIPQAVFYRSRWKTSAKNCVNQHLIACCA